MLKIISRKEKKTSKNSEKRINLDSEAEISDDVAWRDKSVWLKFVKRINQIQVNFRGSIKRKKEERLTIMLIPHNEKSIKNYHISNLTLTIIVSLLILVVSVSASLIINHTSTIQEVDKLKITQKDAQIQFEKIRSEIMAINSSYSQVRSKITDLYKLAKGKAEAESLFGRGGAYVNMENSLDSESLSQAGIVSEQKIEDAEKIPLEIYVLNRILNDMKISEKPLHEIENFIKRREKVIKNTPTIWPVQGYIVNPFGFVRSANYLKAGFNSGIDIATNPGSQVVAAAPGVITKVMQNEDLSWTIKIRHNYGYSSVYSGLDRVEVQEDDKVIKSEALGFTSFSSDSLESIVHYEIYVGVDPQNPMPYMSFFAQ